MNRRPLFVALAAAASLLSFAPAALQAQTAASAPTTAPDDNFEWHDAVDIGIVGRAFDDVASPFDRLPARAKGVVRNEVWSLSRNTAGLALRFETDATQIRVRYKLLTPTLAIPNMAAAGVSGVDLYARVGDAWRWAGSHCPSKQEVDASLITGLPAGKRSFLLHLPLYNGVVSMSVGVPRGATLTPSPAPAGKPIVWYGTSITQGASASRTGLAFTNILSRRLDRTIYNLGFSGNGRTEPEVGQFLAELDPALFILDTVANTTTDVMRERMIAMVKQLRAARPTTPILILEDRDWANLALLPDLAATQAKKRAELRAAYDALVAEGVTGLTYRDSKDLIGEDGEGAIDGSHPNDIGMVRYADALEPTIRPLLK